MKRLLILLAMLSLLFAVGCAKEASEPAPAPAEPEPAPAPEPAPEPMQPKAKGGEVTNVKSAEGVGAGVQKGDGKWLTNIQCGDGLMSFTLTNNHDKALVLRRVGALESSDYEKRQIAKVLVNGRHFDASTKCDVEEGMLAAGSSTDCSASYGDDPVASEVFIRTGVNEFGEAVRNKMDFKAGVNVQATFRCDNGVEKETAEDMLE